MTALALPKEWLYPWCLFRVHAAALPPRIDPSTCEARGWSWLLAQSANHTVPITPSVAAIACKRGPQTRPRTRTTRAQSRAHSRSRAHTTIQSQSQTALRIRAITQLLVATTACQRAAQTTIRTRMTTRGRSQSQTALTTPLPALMTCLSQKTQIWIQTIVLLLIRGVVHGSARLH